MCSLTVLVAPWQAQKPDGRVSTWIEATSHPKIANTAIDDQAYYLGIATRQSSLEYAHHAALLARGLTLAGAATEAKVYADSAKAAFAFGSRTDIRVGLNLSDGVYWQEPAEVGKHYLLHAAANVYLATGDGAILQYLNSDAAFDTEVTDEAGRAFWQGDKAFNLLVFASNPSSFKQSGAGTE